MVVHPWDPASAGFVRSPEHAGPSSAGLCISVILRTGRSDPAPTRIESNFPFDVISYQT